MFGAQSCGYGFTCGWVVNVNLDFNEFVVVESSFKFFFYGVSYAFFGNRNYRIQVVSDCAKVFFLGV